MMMFSSVNELREACRAWAGDNATFRQILASYLSVSGKYQRDVARDLGMAESSIGRWLSGVSRPHPLFEELVIARIAKEMASRAGGKPVRKVAMSAPARPKREVKTKKRAKARRSKRAA